MVAAENVTFQGSKDLDYRDFCSAITLINNKEHFTEEGLLRLKILVSGMNTIKRKVFSKTPFN